MSRTTALAPGRSGAENRFGSGGPYSGTHIGPSPVCTRWRYSKLGHHVAELAVAQKRGIGNLPFGAHSLNTDVTKLVFFCAATPRHDLSRERIGEGGGGANKHDTLAPWQHGQPAE